jgi:hypothetical protein
MSAIDVLWVLPLLAGVGLGLLLRSSVIGLLLSSALLVTSFILFGYSVDHYSNNDCQPGEPCSTAEQIIEVLTPSLFLGASALFLASFGRSIWSALFTGRRRT